MYEHKFSAKTRSLGIARLQMGFFVLLVIFGGLLAVTKYLDLSVLVKGSMDQGVVRAIRQGIAAYAEESRDRGSTPLYPPVLDDAKAGQAAQQNPFFSTVLQRGVAVDGWAKVGRYEYRTPSGERYVYDPLTGEFNTRGTMTPPGINDASQVGQSDTSDR